MALLAGAYVIGYWLWDRRSRRTHRRLVALCDLRGGALPDEIVERLGASVRVERIESYLEADFQVSYFGEAPGVALALIRDEADLEKRLGRVVGWGTFVSGPRNWCGFLANPSRWWNGEALHRVALQALHNLKPRSLAVDFRLPARDVARAHRITSTEKDVDVGMYAYELRCRMRRYSLYQEAEFCLLFCDGEGAWLFRENKTAPDGFDRGHANQTERVMSC
jgi:hypothetical protein